MINLAICDDERVEIEYLRTLITAWAREGKHSIHINDYPSAEAFLFAYDGDKRFDILLLDIQMGGMDGVTLAKRIRVLNKEIQIIFITGHMDYISDGYDVDALHYLLKPVTGEKLASILDRAMEKLARNERALFINQAGESTRIPLYEIRYLEVCQNYVTIHTHGEYTVKKTLGQLEKELDDGFFRTGRSFIVNLRYIRKIIKTEVHLANGMVIPLSRGLYGALNRAMIDRL